MGKKNQYYLFSILLGALAMLVMAAGLFKFPGLFIKYEGLLKCLLDKECLMFNAIIALAAISFANYFVFKARETESEKHMSLKLDTLKFYIMEIVLFLLFAFFKTVSIVNALPAHGAGDNLIKCLLDAECLLWDFLAVLILLFMAGVFIFFFIKRLNDGEDMEKTISGLKTKIISDTKEAFVSKSKTGDLIATVIFYIVTISILIFLIIIFIKSI